MAKLYSKRNNYPIELPFRLRFADGSTRTDQSTFTAEEIAEAGYVEVQAPPEITETQMLGWDGSNWIITEIPQEPTP